MDEVRRVLDRLHRIERLERAGAPPADVVTEVRALLADVERWLAVEPAAVAAAEPKLERCRAALERSSRVPLPPGEVLPAL
jgi:hypothetical protein